MEKKFVTVAMDWDNSVAHVFYDGQEEYLTFEVKDRQISTDILRHVEIAMAHGFTVKFRHFV